MDYLCVRDSEPDLSAGWCLRALSPSSTEWLGFKQQMRSFIFNFRSILCYFSWIHTKLLSDMQR